jgi:DNA-binding winged helix-turn-helix (wHTH) protein/tetratricopeptide (TPR) repeat protein
MGFAPAVRIFPPFRLDPADQCLWQGDDRIAMAPKTFGVLWYLVEHAGRLVTQDELLEALWPETYVQPEVLRKYILEIRKLLSDPPKSPRFIETLPKRGYRFVAAVHPDGSARAMDSLPAAVPKWLVGRETALLSLEEHLQAAVRGQRQVVFITGEAGIGKTTLLDAFEQQSAASVRGRIARGQCVEGFGGKEVYYPVLEGLGQLLRSAEHDWISLALATHAPTWLAQFPSAVKPEQKSELQREILGATRERMVREICEALEVLAAERPLILLLEDLQWVDDSTLDLLSALSRRRGAARLMLVATYRPVDITLSRSPLKVLKQDLLVHHLCHEISLQRLTEADVKRFLDTRFPESSLPALLAGLIHRQSDGNPMFMAAVVDQLCEKGLISADKGRWVLGAPPERLDPGVPVTLQQMLELQLDQLAAKELQLLRVASVAGRRFSAWAVSAMTEGDVSQIEETCERLANRQQFLKRGGPQTLPPQTIEDVSAAAQYEFKHTLYREVLYRQLTASQTRQLHLRLAEKMEALSSPADPALGSELALHFEEGRDYARAIRYLMITASNAARRYAHRDSIQLLQHALELLPRTAVKTGRQLEIEILERISHALYAQGEMVQSAEIDQRTAELAARSGFKAAQVNALTRVARALAFLDPDRCIAVCERAVDVSRTHDDPLLQARAEMLAACWRIVTNGCQKEDAGICASARERIRSRSDEMPAYYEILYAHVQCALGDYEGACRTAWAGIPKSVENDSLVVYLSAHSSLAHAFLHLGRWGDLIDLIAAALEVVDKNGNAPWQGIFRATLAWLRFQAGDLDGARRLAEDLLQSHQEEPAGQVRTMATITAASCDLEAGMSDRALEAFSSVCRRPEYPRFFLDWYWRIVARHGLSDTWLAKGNLANASLQAEAVLQAALSTDEPSLKALAWEMKTRVAMAAGKWPLAEEPMMRALASLEPVEVPMASWRVHLTAFHFFRGREQRKAAAQHRARAEEAISRLAQSFPEGHELRGILPGSPLVHRRLNSPKGEERAARDVPA